MWPAIRSIGLVLLTMTPVLAAGQWWTTGGTGQAIEPNRNMAYKEAWLQAITGIVCASNRVRAISQTSRVDADNADGTWMVTVSVTAQCWVGN